MNNNNLNASNKKTRSLYDKNTSYLICNSLTKIRDAINFIDGKSQHFLILHDWYEYVHSKHLVFISPCIRTLFFPDDDFSLTSVTMTEIKKSRGAIITDEKSTKKNILREIFIETMKTINLEEVNGTRMYPLVNPIRIRAQNNEDTYGYTHAYLFEYIMLHSFLNDPEGNIKKLYLENDAKLPVIKEWYP